MPPSGITITVSEGFFGDSAFWHFKHKGKLYGAQRDFKVGETDLQIVLEEAKETFVRAQEEWK